MKPGDTGVLFSHRPCQRWRKGKVFFLNSDSSADLLPAARARWERIMARPANWTHDRQHFYKYVTKDVAKLILANRSLQWSAAGKFNDPFDSQFDLHLEYDMDVVVEAALERQWEVISGQRQIAAGNALGALLAVLATQQPPPFADKEEFKDHQRPAELEALERGGTLLPLLHASLREQLRDVKFLCLTTDPDHLLMWSHYAKDHTGAVLRISCNEERDSAWGAARPVQYMEEMPRLLSQDELILFLSGEMPIATETTMNRILFSKAAEWAYEGEWRVALHGTEPGAADQLIGFHPSELTGVYLGCRMPEVDAAEIVALSRQVYPHAELFVASKSARRFAIEFASIAQA